jgi:hypothetical protein
VTRLASNAGAILAAIFPLAVCGEVDPTALLNQARAKIVENIERLPKYTCVQTVRRYRYQAVPAVRVNGCDFNPADIDPRLVATWRDQFKLDVTVSQGAEIFSWVGAQRFQTEDVQKIVGGGMTGTGDFGPFLVSIFGGAGARYEYLGPEEDKGRAFAVYRYRVSMAASHYQVVVGPRPENLATVAYEGKFWIDAQGGELIKMTIEVPSPPQESQTCRIETTIDYRRARIGGADFLLPQLTVLKLWDLEGQRRENRIEYESCREFQSESVFRAEPGPAAGAAETPKTPVAIPPGVTVKIALRSRIDSEKSFAGDAIEGRLVNAIGKLVPKGAIVHGRIVRLQQEFVPSKYIALGLKFHSVEVNGSEEPLTLTAVTRRGPMGSELLDPREGIGMFEFAAGRLALDQKFVSEWKTTVREQGK